MTSFWKNLSDTEKKHVSYLMVLMLILLLAVWYCSNRNNSATLPGAKPMSLEYVRVCKSADVCNDEVLLLNGQVVKDSKSAVVVQLQEAINKNPKIRMVCFNSPGGDNDAAEAIGKKIASLNLNTCFAGRYLRANGQFINETMCNSVCPLILLAGQERVSYGEKLVVGFHSSNIYCRFCGFTIWDGENREAEESLRNLLLSYSVINPHRIRYDTEHLKLLSLGFKVSHDKLGGLDSRRALNSFHFYTTIMR